MDKPITDEEEVLKANRQSFRDETIRAFIQEVQSDIQQGRPIIMGGDLMSLSFRLAGRYKGFVGS